MVTVAAGGYRRRVPVGRALAGQLVERVQRLGGRQEAAGRDAGTVALLTNV